jgi:hypothetical protein
MYQPDYPVVLESVLMGEKFFFFFFLGKEFQALFWGRNSGTFLRKEFRHFLGEGIQALGNLIFGMLFSIDLFLLRGFQFTFVQLISIQRIQP